jgi:D-xylose transport system substrate-binding protein
MDALLKGQTASDLKQYTLAELTNDTSKTGNVMANFLPVVQVTKDNVYDLIVKSCFQKYDDVYRDVTDNLPPQVTCQ